MVASSASMASLERFHPYRRAGPSTWCGAADSSAFEPLERGRSCYVITSYCPYSPKCVELEFSEVRSKGGSDPVLQTLLAEGSLSGLRVDARPSRHPLRV